MAFKNFISAFIYFLKIKAFDCNKCEMQSVIPKNAYEKRYV